MLNQEITVGQYLQGQRERRKISLAAVSKETRISPIFLQALEHDDFRLLPAEIYVCGFLQSYAKFIQLEPAELINLYRNQVKPPEDQSREKKEKSSPLRSMKNHLFDFLATIAGGTPAYSVNKSVLPPRD
jgi:cytoskeletal protein RodZ